MELDEEFGRAATLVVVWRTGQKSHGRTVKAGQDVTDELRQYAIAAKALIKGTEGRHYDPDQEQDDTAFLRIDTEDLLDNTIVDQLLIGPSLPPARTVDLKQRRLALYALLLGDDPQNRTIFIRASSPVKLANKGLVAVLDSTLTRVEVPIFAFDEQFDVIISPSGAWALNQANFERLFRDSEPVLAKIGEWVGFLSDKLPIQEASKDELAVRLRQNSLLRRKVQSLMNKPYLASLSPKQIVDKAKQHGLNAEELIQDGMLVVTRSNEKDLLYLLNEDLFSGDFSGTQYAAGRKAPRS